MKENAVLRINHIGKAGVIISRIIRILLIMGGVILLAGTIILALMPNNFLSIKMDGVGKVQLNAPENVTSFISDKPETMDTLCSSFTYNNSRFSVSGARFTETGMEFDAAGCLLDFSSNSMIKVLIIGLTYIIVSIVTMFFVGSLCKAFQNCQSPFENNVIRKMTNLAYALIPWVFLSSLSSGFTNGVLNGEYSFNLVVNFSMIIAILIIFALTFIFKYGAVLQKESDETL